MKKLILLFCLSLFFSVCGTYVHASNVDTVATSTVKSSSATTSMQNVASTTKATTIKQNQVEVEKQVRDYFADTPVMIDIARCESNFRQFTDGGMPFRGGMGGGMVGVFQFYEKIHATAALALGFDLTTLEGNMGYARHVYAEQGTTPWVSCVPAALDAKTKLKIELMTKLVGLLQELLKLELAKQ